MKDLVMSFRFEGVLKKSVFAALLDFGEAFVASSWQDSGEG